MSKGDVNSKSASQTTVWRCLSARPSSVGRVQGPKATWGVAAVETGRGPVKPPVEPSPTTAQPVSPCSEALRCGWILRSGHRCWSHDSNMWFLQAGHKTRDLEPEINCLAIGMAWDCLLLNPPGLRCCRHLVKTKPSKPAKTRILVLLTFLGGHKEPP